jgi:preprotein translocase subunit SecG
MLHTVLLVLQVFCSAGIIGLVLLQRGKGADAGAGFGAGASGTVFGARGATTALSRATAVLAAVFMVNSLALAYMGTHRNVEPKSILDTAAETLPAPAKPATGSPPTAPSAGTPAQQSAPPAPSSGTPAPTAPTK